MLEFRNNLQIFLDRKTRIILWRSHTRKCVFSRKRESFWKSSLEELFIILVILSLGPGIEPLHEVVNIVSTDEQMLAVGALDEVDPSQETDFGFAPKHGEDLSILFLRDASQFLL